MKRLLFIISFLLLNVCHSQVILNKAYVGDTEVAKAYVGDVQVFPRYTIVSRVNLGGASITATDGFINWQDGTSTSGTGWTVSGGATSTFPSNITWTRDASIPSYIPDADFQTLYDTSRQTNASMTFTFTVANGDYIVDILTAEYAQNFQTPTNIDLSIQGNLVIDNLQLSDIFGGFRDAGSLKHTVNVSTGTLTIVLTRNSGAVNLYLNGIQLTKIN